MSKYNHLLSPIRIGNVVLKNRMIASNALPHFLQGPETFPAEPIIHHLANLAKNGAAIVTFADWTNIHQRESFNEDGKRFPMFDSKDPSVQNYFSQLADAVHFYGSKISIAMMNFGPKGYGVCEEPPMPEIAGMDMDSALQNEIHIGRLMRGNTGGIKAITEEMLGDVVEEHAERAKFYQNMGFDMATIHMAYRYPLAAQFLSPIRNKRTDKYGGSLENRARFPLAICQRIKEVCGKNFLVEVLISGSEDGGVTLEDTIGFAKMSEGIIDIIQLRAGNATDSHPTGYNSVEGEHLTVQYAEAVKKSGAKVFVAPIGGFQNPDENDRYIASGKADFIGMARAFICDSEYYKKIYSGRADDIVPCIRCNKCHVPSMTGPWSSVCSVNPVIGLAHRVKQLASPTGEKLKVAVIGGGPAGMEAAIVAARRGHKVTLYEKSSYLGGQLRHADFSSFKWPLKNFKNFLARQLKKEDVKVMLNTVATPALIQEEKYNAVIAAVGAEPNIPNIPGADSTFVRTALSVYGDHASLGKRVVIVGGAETGTETGIFLAQNGHDVTVLTRQDRLASDATPIHYIECVREAWESLDNFSFITNAKTTRIEKGKVVYQDANGNEQTIETDEVVISGGMKALSNEAFSFFGTAERFFMIGDCEKVGCIQTSVRSAFGAASQL
ncbi:MAG: FAD-dependent oxidoreductase [Firmicutes bacterium]|nr:FAD-dependent oxidoreductase [Bacillota bacterium]